MISTFAIHPAASKHLIARGVVSLPEIQRALKKGKIFVGNGTTNIILMEELLQLKTEPWESHVAGVITQGAACVTNPEQRAEPWCVENGSVVNVNWLEFLNSFGPGDIFIKGANAVDPSGSVGILIGDPLGGTIGQAIGILRARGIPIINPVGLEKLIPSCREAQKYMGICSDEPRLGLQLGYIVLSGTTVVTEIESIYSLFGVKCIQVAAGGVGGMEGSVVLAAESQDNEKLSELLGYVKTINRFKSTKIKRKSCIDCLNPCNMFNK